MFWLRNDPIREQGIPDWVAHQDTDRFPVKQGSWARSGYVEFKCEDNFLGSYLKARKDKRHRQLEYIKKYMSNSCIINYNNKVQVVEEYVCTNSSVVKDAPAQSYGGATTSKFVLLSTCTLKNLNIISLESMLNNYES